MAQQAAPKKVKLTKAAKPRKDSAEPENPPNISQAEIDMQSVQTVIEAQSSEVSNAATAIDFLIKKGHITGAADCTLVNLSYILLNISITTATPSSTRAGIDTNNLIRSVAYLITQASLHASTSSLERKLENALEKSSKNLLDKLKANVRLLDATATKYGELTLAAQNTVTSIATTAAQLTSASQEPTRPSYSNIVARQANPPAETPTDAKIANRIALKDRQILIEFAPNALNTPTELTRENEAELKGKAMTAFSRIPGAAAHGNAIRHIQVTSRGHLLMELTTIAAISFLRTPANEATFMAEFAPEGTIRNRSYTVVLRFVPIEFTPHEDESLRQIEQDLGMKPGGIVAASWIKNPVHRSPNQKVANLKLTCSSPQAANHLLISSLHIEGKLVAAKKDVPEPSVCNKCQRYGHFAAKCTEESSTCARCGDPHRTNDCPDKTATRCTPCGSTDHRTNQPQCPEYIKRAQAMEIRTPEILKPFYPTAERWTWDEQAAVPWLPLRQPAILNLGPILETRRHGLPTPQDTRGRKRSGSKSTLSNTSRQSSILPYTISNATARPYEQREGRHSRREGPHNRPLNPATPPAMGTPAGSPAPPPSSAATPGTPTDAYIDTLASSSTSTPPV